MDTEIERLTDEELDELEKRYTADPVPPCRVCGAELSVASMGGGQATQYACSTDEARASIYAEPRISISETHYSRSRWTQYRSGDSHVLRLIAEVREARTAGRP